MVVLNRKNEKGAEVGLCAILREAILCYADFPDAPAPNDLLHRN